MKKKFIYLFCLFFLLIQTNCSVIDPCHKVECGDYGYCVEGSCECLPGVSMDFQGKCNLLDREKFSGRWLTVTSVCGGGSFPQGTPLDFNPYGSQDQVEIIFGGGTEVFKLVGQVSGDSVTIDRQSSGGYSYSGSGSLSSNGALITLNVTREEGIEICEFNITGTR